MPTPEKQNGDERTSPSSLGHDSHSKEGKAKPRRINPSKAAITSPGTPRSFARRFDRSIDMEDDWVEEIDAEEVEGGDLEGDLYENFYSSDGQSESKGEPVYHT